MALKRLSLIRGDSKTYNLAFTQGGTAYSLKNCSIYFTLKTNWILPDAQASLQIINTTAGTSAAGTAGSATVSLLPSHTVNLDVGEYDFDIALWTASSGCHTVMRGKLDLEYDITRSAGTAGTAA